VTGSGSRSESHVAQLQARVATIEHHERPEYLDRLSMLRDQIFALDHLFLSLFSTLGWSCASRSPSCCSRRCIPS
jgi:hypothetical protein